MTSQNDYFKTPAQIFADMKELAELQDYANAQFELINQLKQEIELVKQENDHLKQLLSSVPKGAIIHSNPMDDEELICIEQIKKLKEQSRNRELTLDEVKKLDLLHKNLKIKRDNSIIDIKPTKQKSLSSDKLLAIVAKKSDTDE